MRSATALLVVLCGGAALALACAGWLAPENCPAQIALFDPSRCEALSSTP